MDYREAGVDVAAGADAVERMRASVESTHDERVLGSIGGFGALYHLTGFRDPVLVSGADGVGTKVELARTAGRFDTIGIDLVAMCVNDIICHGARPLFFLDYIAVDRLDPDHVAAVVAGVADGCRIAGCSLVGGETAEMPGVYRAGRFDLAGFAVGAVERDAVIDGRRVAAGDVVVGFASSGLHSNGFSLLRRAIPAATTDPAVAARFLEPTRIYAPLIAALQNEVALHGMAHVTGGGWDENVPRLLGVARPHFALDLDRSAVPVPPPFGEVAAAGVSPDEMYRTFNMGLGFAVAVDPGDVDRVRAVAAAEGIESWPIGTVRARG